MGTTAKAEEGSRFWVKDERWIPILMEGTPGNLALAARGESHVAAHKIADVDAGFQFLDGGVAGRGRVVRGLRMGSGRCLRSQRFGSIEEPPEIIRAFAEVDEEIGNVAAVAHVVRQPTWSKSCCRQTAFAASPSLSGNRSCGSSINGRMVNARRGQCRFIWPGAAAHEGGMPHLGFTIGKCEVG